MIQSDDKRQASFPKLAQALRNYLLNESQKSDDLVPTLT
jgi:hypothetical protein